MTYQHKTGRSLRLFLIVGVATLALALLMTPEHATANAPRKKKGSIGKVMRGMKKDLKATATKLQDPGTAEEALKNIQAMQEHMMSLKFLDPPGLKDLPEEAQPQRQKEFRLAAARVLRELVDMEIDVLEGRSEDAMNRVMSSLFELREAAHDEFQEEK